MMKTKAMDAATASDGQKTERLNTFKEAIRKVAVVGVALAATASVSSCVPFYGQVGMVGGYTEGQQIIYSEVGPYGSYSEGGVYYNYGEVLPYYNYTGVVPDYEYNYEYRIPDYDYRIPDYDYGRERLNYNYREMPNYDYNRGYRDMPGRDYGDMDGGRMGPGHRR